MPQDNISTANYVAVIADLRAKRDELDRVISLLEAMAQINPPSQTSVIATASVAMPLPVAPSIRTLHADVKPSNVVGTGIGERCMAILRDHGNARPMSTRQVTDALLASGFTLNTKSPPNNVWSALSHRAKVSKDVERVGNNWRYIGSHKKHETAEGAAQNQMNGNPAFVSQTLEN